VRWPLQNSICRIEHGLSREALPQNLRQMKRKYTMGLLALASVTGVMPLPIPGEGNAYSEGKANGIPGSCRSRNSTADRAYSAEYSSRHAF